MYGAFVSIPSPNVVEILGYSGLDFVIIDCEHGPADVETAEDMIRGAEVSGITPIVRVRQNDPSEIVRYLDRGAQGVQIPMISSRSAAEAAVRASKYYPEGMRGMGGARPSEYSPPGTPAHNSYFEDANREIMVICHIESLEAVNNLPEILTVKGVDVFFVAPGDLSQSLGYPDKIFLPSVRQIIDNAIDEIRQAGRIPGYVSVEPEFYFKKGVRYFAGLDANFLISGAGQYLKTMQDACRS